MPVQQKAQDSQGVMSVTEDFESNIQENQVKLEFKLS